MFIRRFAVFALMVLCISAASAQTTKDDAQLQAEIEKAKADAAESKLRARKAELDLQQAEDKAKLDLQKAQDLAEEARRAAVKDASKSLSDIALKGEIKDVTVVGTPIETRVLTYRAVVPIAKQIVFELTPRLCALKATAVVLTDDLAISALPVFQAAVISAETIANQYSSIIDQSRKIFAGLRTNYQTSQRSGAFALPMILEGVSALASLAQTFKTQIGVTNTDVSIDPLAIYGALVSAWSIACPENKGLDKVQGEAPQTASLTAFPGLNVDYSNTKIGATLKRLNELQSQGLDLETEIALWLQQAKADAAKKDGGTAAPGTPKPTGGKSSPTAKEPANNQQRTAEAATAKLEVVEKVEEVLAKLKAANQRVDLALQGFVTTSDRQPISPLIQLIRIERLSNALGQQGTFALVLKAVAAGGNSVATNNLWTGPKLYHSGGAVLAYTLIERSGIYAAGGVLDSHTGYIRLTTEDQSTLGNSWQPPP